MAQVNCPKCSQPITYAEGDVGKAVKCPACGVEVFAVEAGRELVSLKCAACGGALDYRPGMAQVICPFCNASYLLPPLAQPKTAEPVGGLPEFLTPFGLQRHQLMTPLQAWLNKGTFTARDADTAATVTSVNGKYVPLYVFACDATSNWAGQYSTSHTRMVSRPDGRGGTHMVSEEYKQWHPTSGVHSGHYRVAVAMTNALPQADLDKMYEDGGNFNADQGAVPYASAARDEFTIENRALAPDAARQTAYRKVEALEHNACGREVERLSSCSTHITNPDARVDYHPFWWITYQYKGKSFNCVMDGKTGAATGKKPVGKGKVIVAIILGLLVVILIIIAIVCLAGGTCVSEMTSSLGARVAELARALA